MVRDFTSPVEAEVVEDTFTLFSTSASEVVLRPFSEAVEAVDCINAAGPPLEVTPLVLGREAEPLTVTGNPPLDEVDLGIRPTTLRPPLASGDFGGWPPNLLEALKGLVDLERS